MGRPNKFWPEHESVVGKHERTLLRYHTDRNLCCKNSMLFSPIYQLETSYRPHLQIQRSIRKAAKAT